MIITNKAEIGFRIPDDLIRLQQFESENDLTRWVRRESTIRESKKKLKTNDENKEVRKMDDLKQCPFCGSVDVELKNGAMWGYAVCCNECGADVIFHGLLRIDNPDYDYSDEVIRAWNRRTDKKEVGMMDTVKFFEEYKRMCESYGSNTCKGCALFNDRAANNLVCPTYVSRNPEKCVYIVEKWSKEHPIMTNKMKFEEVFGKTCDESGELVLVRPSWLMEEYKAPKGEE